MTPLSRPQYGLATLLWALGRRRAAPSIADVESAFADALGARAAVMFPSCRAAIGTALRLAAAPAVASAFTCPTVWQAARFAAAPLTILDVAADGFLMDPAELRAVAPGAALILSEVFGYRYDLRAVPASGPGGPALRIVDMAMSIPSRDRLDALADRDLVALSFGSRKCLGAGWGGMILTRDGARAEGLRDLRARLMRPPSGPEARRRATRLLAVHLTRGPLTYAALTTWQRARRGTRPAGRAAACAAVPPADVFGEDWSSLPALFERDLVLHNLARLGAMAERRRRLAGAYECELEGVGWLRLPPRAHGALSHFTIRVGAELREPLRAWLAACGIETGRLFFFSSRLDAATYPRARRLADEVINLPLDPRLSEARVRWIARRIAAFSPRRSPEPVDSHGAARAGVTP